MAKETADASCTTTWHSDTPWPESTKTRTECDSCTILTTDNEKKENVCVSDKSNVSIESITTFNVNMGTMKDKIVQGTTMWSCTSDGVKVKSETPGRHVSLSLFIPFKDRSTLHMVGFVAGLPFTHLASSPIVLTMDSGMASMCHTDGKSIFSAVTTVPSPIHKALQF